MADYTMVRPSEDRKGSQKEEHMKLLMYEREVDTLELEPAVKDILKRQLRILDESYGKDRKMDDLGGFSVILEEENELEKLKNYHLHIDELIPEYVDYIQTDSEENWVVALYLLSSDYSITLFMPMYIAPIEMLREQEILLDPLEKYHVIQRVTGTMGHYKKTI